MHPLDAIPCPLHPRLGDPGEVAALAARWRETGGCLRIDGLLAPGLAEALEGALLELPFESHLEHDEHVRCFFWRCIVAVPGPDAPPLPPPFDRAARLVLRDIPALAAAISGRPVRGPTSEWVIACRYRKGSYLDVHNDHGPGQAIAYVVGLTRAAWPAEQGGHLEFLASDRETVLERRAPGWDTLDLYDVHPAPRWHRVPLLLEHAERLTLSGWIHSPLEGP